MKTKKHKKIPSYCVQICFSNGNSCIEMLQYLLFWYLTVNIFFCLDLVTWNVVLLAQNFLKIDSRITKALRCRLFRYQTFTQLLTEIRTLNEHVSNWKQNKVVNKSDLSCILNAILLDNMPTISMTGSMLEILHMIFESLPLSFSYKSVYSLIVIMLKNRNVYVSFCLMKLNGTERNICNRMMKFKLKICMKRKTKSFQLHFRMSLVKHVILNQ